MKGIIGISGALAFGIALVVGAVFLSSERQPATVAQAVSVTPANARDYIPVKDSDGDGVSDWEEQFSKQIVAPISGKNEDPTYEPPKTLTGQYGIRFFNNFMRGGGATKDLSEDEQGEIIDNALVGLGGPQQKIFYTANDLILGDSTDAALREYGNSVATILLTYTSSRRDNELEIVLAATREGEYRLEELDPILITYRQFIDEMLRISVPPELAKRHVRIINTTQGVYESIAGFDTLYSDPLRALMYIEKYDTDTTMLLSLFSTTAQYLFERGMRYTEDEPVNRLLKIAQLSS